MTLFNTKPDTLDGFDTFWSLWPKDRRRAGRKAGKKKCQTVWASRKLYTIKTRVIAALKEDIKDIEKGSYALGDDKMHYFPGIQPWLNQEKYDRDIPEPKQDKPKPKQVEPKSKPMSREQFEKLKPKFREMAKIK